MRIMRCCVALAVLVLAAGSAFGKTKKKKEKSGGYNAVEGPITGCPVRVVSIDPSTLWATDSVAVKFENTSGKDIKALAGHFDVVNAFSDTWIIPEEGDYSNLGYKPFKPGKTLNFTTPDYYFYGHDGRIGWFLTKVVYSDGTRWVDTQKPQCVWLRKRVN